MITLWPSGLSPFSSSSMLQNNHWHVFVGLPLSSRCPSGSFASYYTLGEWTQGSECRLPLLLGSGPGPKSIGLPGVGEGIRQANDWEATAAAPAIGFLLLVWRIRAATCLLLGSGFGSSGPYYLPSEGRLLFFMATFQSSAISCPV